MKENSSVNCFTSEWCETGTEHAVNTKCWVVEQMGFAKQSPDSPHLHHVTTNYAEFAFQQVKSSQRSVVVPLPQKANAFRGPQINKTRKNSFVYLKELSEQKCSFSKNTACTLKTKQRQDMIERYKSFSVKGKCKEMTLI